MKLQAHYPGRPGAPPDGWTTIVEGSSAYLAGWMDARQEMRPRPAMRIVSDAGRVKESCTANDDPRLGMIAGFPTAEQYLSGARRCLEALARGRCGEEADPEMVERAKAALEAIAAGTLTR